VECRLARPDGTTVWVALLISMLRDYDGNPVQLTIIEDISEQKRLERSLRASEARFSRLQKSGLLGVAFEEDSSNLTEANDALLEMIGCTRADLIAGRVDLRTMTPPEYRAVEMTAREELRTQGLCHPYEKAVLRSDGKLVWLLIGAAK